MCWSQTAQQFLETKFVDCLSLRQELLQTRGRDGKTMGLTQALRLSDPVQLGADFFGERSEPRLQCIKDGLLQTFLSPFLFCLNFNERGNGFSCHHRSEEHTSELQSHS